ncbi:MAG: class I SAM-dependent methyltransferase [Geminicoccaceae bacterium]
MIRKVFRRIFDNTASIAACKASDSLALNLLDSIDVGLGFKPWTRAAMRPSTIVHVLNEIFINDRKSIIEFGSGISTLYFAWAAKETNSHIISIEENEDWSAKIKGMLIDQGLDKFCDIHVAERKNLKIKDYTSYWYDLEKVRGLIDCKKVDLVIVDGPTAFQKGQENARRPAIDVLEPNLADSCAIFLDDALRAGEQAILRAWEASLGLKAELEPIAGGHAYIGRGPRYFSGL